MVSVTRWRHLIQEIFILQEYLHRFMESLSILNSFTCHITCSGLSLYDTSPSHSRGKQNFLPKVIRYYGTHRFMFLTTKVQLLCNAMPIEEHLIDFTTLNLTKNDILNTRFQTNVEPSSEWYNLPPMCNNLHIIHFYSILQYTIVM